MVGWDPNTDVTTFGGKLGSSGFQSKCNLIILDLVFFLLQINIWVNLTIKQLFADIASGDLLQPCSASSGSSNTISSPSPTTTPETPCTNCTTTDGRRCQFPFFIDGKEYNSCTLDHTAEGTTTPWCATRVDGMGNWLSRQENT